MSPPVHVVLVYPEIPWNTGNIGRTCLAAGARLHLVEPLGFSLEDRYLHRAGLDYWPRVDLRVWPSWEAIAAGLPELARGWYFTSEATRPYWEADLTDPAVLVFGKESVGLPEPIRRRHATRLLGIPMADPELRSLNLSSSAAIATYEALRQLRAG